MATVTRLYQPTPAQLNQGAQKSDTVPYLVRGITFGTLKRDILNGLGVPNSILPNIGDAHPDNPTLLCRSLRVQPLANGSGDDSEVYADFTTSNFPGAGLLHAAVDLSEGQFVLEASFQDVDVQVPTARLREYAVSGNPPTGNITAWETVLETVTETRMVLRAKWSIFKYGGLKVADMRIFGEETNRLHELGGDKYLFRAGSVIPKDNNTYEVRASWEQDTGTPTVKSKDKSKYLMPGDMYYIDGAAGLGLMRDPYNKLITAPAVLPDAPPDDVASWPLVAQVPYAVDGDHTRLPGIPNL